MRDATPKDERPDADRLAAPTAGQRAEQIRAATAEVLTRVQEWRDSPTWRDTDTNRHRYQATVDACTAFEARPGRSTPEEHDALVDTIRALVAVWGPSRPGPEEGSRRHRATATPDAPIASGQRQA